jgi:hypothetical protein
MGSDSSPLNFFRVSKRFREALSRLQALFDEAANHLMNT